ncbi:MAG: penicillin-binding transpeptidase domain-containing protein, partial [Clostridiales bacterium]
AVVLMLTLIAFCVVILKLAMIQFVQGADLQAKADELRTKDLPVAASRGTIYDRNGNKLAFSITADSISASPPDVKNSGKTEETAEFLAQVLDMDVESLLDRLSSKSSFEWIKRKVDFDVAEKIKDAELPGIDIIEETQRYYPKGMLASHVIGFAGIDNQGLDGVELSLDDILAGENGRIVGEYDAKGRLISQAAYEYIPPVDGSDVYLTIDENIQFFAERELDALMESATPPLGAGVLIMRPKTGEILAAAYRDAYDPNHYGDYPASTIRNFLVSDAFEPGSIFKIITASTALEEGVADLNSRYYDPGYIMISGKRIGCWSNVPHGSQSFAEAVQNSCNPAFATIGLNIESKEKGLFYKYIHAYGFGSATGVQLPGEATGIMIPDNAVHDLEIATISIGQGIAVTPIQMCTAVCAVANGGVLLKPQIVLEVKDVEGNATQVLVKQPVRQVISAETASTMLEVLQGVVTDGSGFKAAIPGYKIAGKTGTAQKAKDGRYEPGKYVASFIGIAPADDPELVCLVVLDEPSGVYYGSQVAAPIFSAVVSDTLRYLGIVPTAANMTEQPMARVEVMDVTNLRVDEAEAALRLAGFKVEIIGQGDVVVSQLPAAYTMADEGSLVSLELGKAPATGTADVITVPDFTGKRIAEVAALLSAMGLKLNSSGSGEAVEQQPAPGKKVAPGTTVAVTFSQSQQTAAGSP